MQTFEKYLPFTPNEEQNRVLVDLFRFVNSDDERDVMILKGAAGTGKTSILEALNRFIKENGQNCRFATPTGRAANVLYNKVNSDVKTIHSMIFIPQVLDNGIVKFNLREANNDGHTIYIIDESSMISDSVDVSGQYICDQPLLTSLIRYIKMGDEKNKIIFVGDPYQLPPVVSDHERSFSPALEANYLERKFNMATGVNELKQIMRQTDNSPVLDLASSIRDEIEKGNNMYCRYPQKFNGWWHIKDRYLEKFDIENTNKVTVICHQNRDVNWWNKLLRDEIFPDSSNLCNTP